MNTSHTQTEFPYALESCVWEITLACPFSCKYCGSGGGRARENELSANECEDIAGQLAALGCRRVSLIGGEVFARPDWDRIVSFMTSRGVRVAVITNGYVMTPDLLDRLQNCGVESVAFSIDGPERVHDRFRAPGSFRRAFESLSAVASEKIPVSVISALRADNYPLLEEFYEILTGYPIFAWQLQACSPMGNAKKNGIDTRIDAGYIMNFVDSHADYAPFVLGIADNIGYYSPAEGRLRGRRDKNSRFTGCGAGLTSIGIDSIGNVRGCESMYDPRFIEGNLRERSLRDIWEDADAFSYNRKFTPDMLKGGCARCRYGDVCAAGCRSYNYFTNSGNLYENVLCPRAKGG